MNEATKEGVKSGEKAEATVKAGYKNDVGVASVDVNVEGTMGSTGAKNTDLDKAEKAEDTLK